VIEVVQGAVVSLEKVSITSGSVGNGGSGGGILNSGTLTIRNASISGNAVWDGFAGGISNQGRLTMEQCSVSSNFVFWGDGGGLANFGDLEMLNCTISGNVIDWASGAGFYDRGIATLRNTTVAGNSVWYASQPGLTAGIDAGPDHTLENCIVAGNFAYMGSGVDPGVEFYGDDLGGFPPTLSGANFIGGDPELRALGDFGGPTPTMPPLPGSPVIDAAVILASTPATDQRGSARISGPAPDLGAVELRQVIVDTLADESDGSEVGGVSLREVIDETEMRETELVRFTAALSGGTILLGESGLEVTAPRIAIDATTLADGITLDGGGKWRIFEIAADAQLWIDSLTMVRGRAENSGGGFLNHGTLELRNSTITRCLAIGDGGAIWNSGRLSVQNSTIADNLAADNGGGLFNAGDASLVHATLSENVAFFGNGGGIRNDNLMALSNSIIAGNHTWEGDPNVVGGFVTSGENLTSGDPYLAPLAVYGGATPTMPPLPGSPVIDAGSVAVSLPFDQRGSARPVGPLPDLGSVEAFPFSQIAMVDLDGDGVDDRLEPALRMTVGIDDSMRDSDGDGSTDSEEIANMTDPFDPNSRLRIVSMQPALDYDPVGSPWFDVTFTSFPGLHYSIECDRDLEFSGDSARVSVFGVADDHISTTRILLSPERDFLRIRRDP
jgi:hypothetical protein